MEEIEFKEQEQWIEKYRAAVEAVSKKPPESPGLGALVDGVRTHLQVAIRSARARLRKSIPPLESGETVMTSPAPTPPTPIEDGQPQQRIIAEPTSPPDLEKAG